MTEKGSTTKYSGSGGYLLFVKNALLSRKDQIIDSSSAETAQALMAAGYELRGTFPSWEAATAAQNDERMTDSLKVYASVAAIAGGVWFAFAYKAKKVASLAGHRSRGFRGLRRNRKRK